MGTLDDLHAIDEEYPADLHEVHVTESDVLSEGTASSRLLTRLQEKASETGLDYAFIRGKGGTEQYTLGSQTASLRVHVSADNIATFLLSSSDLNYDWWKKLTDEVLNPRDVIVE
jgi:hypothetical protein